LVGCKSINVHRFLCTYLPIIAFLSFILSFILFRCLALLVCLVPQAEPRQYAALALLKLADNFENHVAIAKAVYTRVEPLNIGRIRV